MPDIEVFTTSGKSIGVHLNAHMDATDLGEDTPDRNFASIQTPDGVVDYFGPTIVKVSRGLDTKEGE